MLNLKNLFIFENCQQAALFVTVKKNKKNWLPIHSPCQRSSLFTTSAWQNLSNQAGTEELSQEGLEDSLRIIFRSLREADLSRIYSLKISLLSRAKVKQGQMNGFWVVVNL